jgi:aryl-alcohol dehydrogenase-like predicted oxidoreductase
MKQSKIPKTDLNVSEICLGTMTFGSPVGKKKACQLIEKAIDMGVNFIDTANMYEGYTRVPGSAGGVAESIIGEALKGKRDQVVLATKIGMCVGTAREDKGTSPAAIRKHLELSLKRLNTDFVDIYYLHSPDPDTPIIEVLDELDRVIHQGKVRYYGISNFSVEQLNYLLTTADENKLPDL